MITAPDYPYEEERRRIVDECSECGMDILEGETYYDINGDFICVNCMSGHKKYAIG